MINKFSVAALAIFCGLGLTAWTSYAQNQPSVSKDQINSVMQRKLEYAQELLQALATEDYEKISKNSQALNLLSLESAWNTIVTEEYLKQSNSFRNALEAMRDGAKDENIDRATLGYVDMTIRCVECHKYLKAGVVEEAVQENAGK